MKTPVGKAAVNKTVIHNRIKAGNTFSYTVSRIPADILTQTSLAM